MSSQEAGQHLQKSSYSTHVVHIPYSSPRSGFEIRTTRHATEMLVRSLNLDARLLIKMAVDKSSSKEKHSIADSVHTLMQQMSVSGVEKGSSELRECPMADAQGIGKSG